MRLLDLTPPDVGKSQPQLTQSLVGRVHSATHDDAAANAAHRVDPTPPHRARSPRRCPRRALPTPTFISCALPALCRLASSCLRIPAVPATALVLPPSLLRYLPIPCSPVLLTSPPRSTSLLLTPFVRPPALSPPVFNTLGAPGLTTRTRFSTLWAGGQARGTEPHCHKPTVLSGIGGSPVRDQARSRGRPLRRPVANRHRYARRVA